MATYAAARQKRRLRTPSSGCDSTMGEEPMLSLCVVTHTDHEPHRFAISPHPGKAGATAHKVAQIFVKYSKKCELGRSPCNKSVGVLDESASKGICGR